MGAAHRSTTEQDTLQWQPQSISEIERNTLLFPSVVGTPGACAWSQLANPGTQTTALSSQSSYDAASATIHQLIPAARGSTAGDHPSNGATDRNDNNPSSQLIRGHPLLLAASQHGQHALTAQHVGQHSAPEAQLGSASLPQQPTLSLGFDSSGSADGALKVMRGLFRPVNANVPPAIQFSTLSVPTPVLLPPVVNSPQRSRSDTPMSGDLLTC